MENLQEYIPILVFLILALIISIGAVFMSFLFAKQNPYSEKHSTY